MENEWLKLYQNNNIELSKDGEKIKCKQDHKSQN